MNLLDWFRGKAVTIPPLDGALKPNTRLEEASIVAELPSPDAVATDGTALYVSSGNAVLKLDGKGKATPVAEFIAPVTAFAVLPDGAVVVGLDDNRILLKPAKGGETLLTDIPAPTAFAVEDSVLYVASGSSEHKASEWARDLMAKGSTGSVWRVPLSGGKPAKLAGNLAFANGIAIDATHGRLVVSEAWKHRLVALSKEGGAPTPVLSNLPGYPSRIAKRPGAGYLLTLFAPRNRLIEFVLLEDQYRADMLRDVPPEFWIAPALASNRSFLEPLQCGGVRTMGIHKPWSPSRSYGLVVELDEALQPLRSHHSRADGRRHGITSAIDFGGGIAAASKGGDVVVSIDTGKGARA
ncbi:MAG: hypothetical protein U1E46_10210 [Hyphomicrobiales bacterium]